MPSQRILTNPVRLTGSVHPQQLSSLVAVDAMVRRRKDLGLDAPIWELTTLSGDAAVQRAVQKAVAREGDVAHELGRDKFAARARRLEAEAEVDLRTLLTGLQVGADLDRWTSGSDEDVKTARVAFVRLFEAGVLKLSDAVLDSCPSCQTVVDEADSDEAYLQVDHLKIAIPLVNGKLEMALAEPELLVGAVALAVPAESVPNDTTVLLPLTEVEVPVIAVVDLEAPVLVVPGHNRWSYDLARKLSLPVVEVLDAEGVVRHPGALEGLGRYAARSAATEMLAAEGSVVGHFEAAQLVRRCHRCGTVLVPLLGRHWILSLSTLAEPVVEAVLAGQISFSPLLATDHLLEAAERAGSWCVSQQLWSGSPIPVSTCLDCGQMQVSVTDSLDCGVCMGTLAPHTDVLDARFIAAVTPLAMMGWPNNLEEPGSVVTTLSVGVVGLDAWALPIAALGLRLADVLPFNQVVVHQLAIGANETGLRPTREFIEMVELHGHAIVRAALLAGDFDIDRAKAALEDLHTPLSGTNDVSVYRDAYDKAIGSLDAGGALGLMVNASREGLDDEAIATLQAFAAPVLGEHSRILSGTADRSTNN